jgi:ATP-dependent protease HslVU (ClpYQ) peptidase subunit
MTCIVGLIYNDAVYMGADSAHTNDAFQVVVRPDPKIFLVNHVLIGSSGSPRLSQLLRHTFSELIPPVERDIEKYMCIDFIKALRVFLKAHDHGDDLLSGSELIVGVRGRLFCVYGDFQVEESVLGYNAIGSAAEIALGSLHSTQNVILSGPMERIHMALFAAQEHNATVRKPFVFLEAH